jgi:hypothetical protein
MDSKLPTVDEPPVLIKGNIEQPSVMFIDRGLPTFIVIRGKRRDRTYSVHEQEDGSILLMRSSL